MKTPTPALRTGLTLQLAAAALAILLHAAPPAGAGQSPAEAPPPSSPQAALDRATAMLEAARAAYLTEANCPFSPAGAVLRVGGDPTKLCAFVREKIGYEPYPGSVRGPEGTLAAGAGSDWDRALLLRALLAEAGWGCELSVVVRSERDRLAVVDAFLSGQGRERTLGAGSRPAPERLPPVSPLLEEFGVTLNNRDLRLSSALTRWQGMLDNAFDSGWTQAGQLKTVLGQTAKPQPFAAWRQHLAAGAAERVFLRLPGNQGFLDVSPDAAPLADAAARKAKPLKEVPADRLAMVDLRAVLRVAAGDGKIKPTAILEHSAPLASLLGRNLRLQVVPEASEAPAKPMIDWSPADCHDFLTGCQRFQAILESCNLWKASPVFDRQGNLFTVGSDGRIEAAKGLGSSVGKVFGGFGAGGGDDDEAGPKGSIESLELEIDLRLPGSAPVKIRRLLCGRLRPESSPVTHTDIVCFPGPVGADTTQWFALDASARNFSVTADVMSGRNLDAHLRGAKVQVVQRMLYEWQLARLGLADRVLSSDKDCAYAGGPAVAMKTAMLLPVSAPKSVNRRTVIDVAYDGQRLIPRSEAAVRAAFEGNILLGASCTAVETQLLREKQPGSDPQGACGDFQQAALAGGKATVREAGKLAGVQLPELVRWGIAANQHREILVFPGTDAPRSWWSIDPATGITLGRGDGGEGMSATEYLNIIKVNLSNLKCVVQVMGAAIRGGNKDQAAREWLMCVTGADNPGTYVGAYGGTVGLGMEGGSGLSMAGDILGGVWDVAGMAGSK
jgi:hypothetical protein